MPARLIEPVPIVQAYADQGYGPRFGIRSGRVAARDPQLHRHDYFEVWFFATGASTQRIALRERVAHPGSIFFISPMTPHRPRFNADDMCFILYFDLAFLHPELTSSYSHIDVELLARAPELAPFTCQERIDFAVPDGDFEIVLSQFRRIFDEQSRPRVCSKEIVRSLVSQLLAEITQKYEEQIFEYLNKSAPTGVLDRHVKRALGFIGDNLTKKLSLTAAARQVAVSPNHLANLLKRETGKTFVEIVTEKRINKASELLSYTNWHIAEIAYNVGFEDPDYFSKRFKFHTGCTPLEFRDAHKPVWVKRSPEENRHSERH